MHKKNMFKGSSMDFNANGNFLGLTTQQSAQLQKMIQSGEGGSIVAKGPNGAPIVDFNSSTLKETEGKKFDSNNFGKSDAEVIPKDKQDGNDAMYIRTRGGWREGARIFLNIISGRGMFGLPGLGDVIFGKNDSQFNADGSYNKDYYGRMA